MSLLKDEVVLRMCDTTISRASGVGRTVVEEKGLADRPPHRPRPCFEVLQEGAEDVGCCERVS